jgi:anti-sigma regulatory factor (Ser/Thr protein kinase)
MREIALHLLDLAENSVAAGARNVTLSVSEDLKTAVLKVVIDDDGRGMDAETVRRVTDPFYTSRTTRNVGLGIPLFKEAAEMAGGGMEIRSQPGVGTCVEVHFLHSHIDRMPLGRLEDTFLTLLSMHAGVHWIFRYAVQPAQGEARAFEFDDAPVKETLGNDVPLTHPDVLAYLRENICAGMADVRDGLKV